MLKIAFICLVLVYEAYGLDGVAKRSLDLSRKLKKKKKKAVLELSETISASLVNLTHQ